MAWIENQYGEVLLLKQERGRRLWTLPGGKVRSREALKTALQREVREETGLKVEILSLRCVFDRPLKGGISFLYAARIKNRREKIEPRAGEIETAKFSAVLAKNATPSLRYFWKFVREGSA